jgi:squalene-hopene/tetraprenyl-beta-curcumene cyclase
MEHGTIIHLGIRWLIEHQNSDGGWGDTVRSLSNISTTALCWAALSVAGDEVRNTVAAAEAWLARAAGSLEPLRLAGAIADRYGKDRTFSVPILTMCALAGRLGEEGWKHVPQLPFELAACPQSWFRFLRLPVVSYALPALIAMGQVRHHRRPTLNPLLHVVRDLSRQRTLAVLQQIQPQGGGFLEATPLTSFVLMSLVGAGLHGHPVAKNAADFLVRSARPDGSWAIDTNLATWLTTLSINALSISPGFEQLVTIDQRLRLRDWLLDQQYTRPHPYTGAEPGGWAWTNLPGGVPDADDTAGALLALRNLGFINQRTLDAARAGVTWLLDSQNRDGGIPTFCRGWGNLPFDRSGCDLTAHALLAWDAWQGRMPEALAQRIAAAAPRAVDYLARQQRKDGSWLPLWFGNQHAAGEENAAYGTARVLPALHALVNCGLPAVVEMRQRGLRWLLENQNADGGWGGANSTPSSIEETALAVHALVGAGDDEMTAAARGMAWLTRHTDQGRRFEASPIGFYFAKLWYFEKLYPLIFTVGALASPKLRGAAKQIHGE